MKNYTKPFWNLKNSFFAVRSSSVTDKFEKMVCKINIWSPKCDFRKFCFQELDIGASLSSPKLPKLFLTKQVCSQPTSESSTNYQNCFIPTEFLKFPAKLYDIYFQVNFSKVSVPYQNFLPRKKCFSGSKKVMYKFSSHEINSWSKKNGFEFWWFRIVSILKLIWMLVRKWTFKGQYHVLTRLYFLFVKKNLQNFKSV